MGHVETEKNLKMSEEMLTVNTPGFEEEEKKQQVLKKPVLEKKTSDDKKTSKQERASHIMTGY